MCSLAGWYQYFSDMLACTRRPHGVTTTNNLIFILTARKPQISSIFLISYAVKWRARNVLQKSSSVTTWKNPQISHCTVKTNLTLLISFNNRHTEYVVMSFPCISDDETYGRTVKEPRSSFQVLGCWVLSRIKWQTFNRCLLPRSSGRWHGSGWFCNSYIMFFFFYVCKCLNPILMQWLFFVYIHKLICDKCSLRVLVNCERLMKKKIQI